MGNVDPTPILFLIDTGGPGGAETVLATLVDALDPQAWRPRVLVPERDWLWERLKVSGHDVRHVPSSGSADVRYLGSLWREIQAFRPAVVHAHLFTSGVYSSMASAAAGRPPVVTTFHGAPDVSPDDRLLGLKAWLVRRRAHEVVFVSHDLERTLRPVLGLAPDCGQVIHNGVPFPDGRPEPLPLGLPAGSTVVGAVGNVRRPKDYPNLLRAARIVCDRRPDVHVVVAGDGGGELLEEVLGIRRDLGLEGRVHLLGFQDDVPAFLAALDLFVSSSSSEGLPLATLEALGAGLPAVLTDCGGPAEIIDDGRTGVLVPPENSQALAAGILDVLSRPDQGRNLGAAARTEVRREFGVQRMVEQYEALYERVAR
jgi:glycosyltransferase involved in cell wall biosynthesis